jgi:DNA-binding transcriptional ArsR family regulator
MTGSTQAVFTALADPTRRLLLQRLAEGGAKTITQLSHGLPITRQAVTKHLAVLDEAGLVAVQKVGREQHCTLTPEPLSEAMAWMATLGARWDERLAALQQFLAEEVEQEANPEEKPGFPTGGLWL